MSLGTYSKQELIIRLLGFFDQRKCSGNDQKFTPHLYPAGNLPGCRAVVFEFAPCIHTNLFFV